MADEVQVKLGAEISSLKNAMSDAQASVGNALAKMGGALSEHTDQSKAFGSAIAEVNNNLGGSYESLLGRAKTAAEGIGTAFTRLQGVIVAAIGVIGAGSLFRDIIDSTLKLEDSVRGLEIVFGMSTEAAQKQNIQLRLAGISAEQYETMAMRVARSLRTQQEEWERLGVVIKDGNGNLLPLDQIMKNLYQRMQDFRAGTDQDMVIMSLAGRTAKDFAGDMQRLMAAESEAAKIAEKFGDTMGAKQQNDVEEYRRRMNAFGIVIDDIKVKIGLGLLPVLEKLGNWFAAMSAETVTGNTPFERFLSAVGIATAKAKTELMTIPGTVDSAMAAFRKMEHEGPPVPGRGTLGYTPKPTGGEDNIAALENELKTEQNAFNQRMLAQGSFQVWSIAQTRDYWEEVLSLTTLSTKQRQEAENRYYDAERAVQEQAFAAVIANLEKEKEGYKFNFDERIRLAEEEARLIAQKYGEGSAQAIIAEKRVTEEKQKQVAQRIALADIEQRSQEAMFKHDIEMARLVEDQKVALGLESNAQRLANESAYISALYAKDLEGINARIAAWTEAEGPEALARLNAEKLKIEEAYQRDLTKLDNAAVLEREKYAIEATNAIRTAMSDLISNLITNTKNWKQTLMDAFKALDDQLVKIAANQLVQQYLGAGSTGGGFLSGLMSKIFGGGAGGSSPVPANTTAVTELTLAVKENTVALQTSFSSGGTFSSLFGGGSTFGSLFGGGDFIGGAFPVFASGTSYVPQDTLAMVHRGEAIIPASQNQPGSFGGSVNMRNTFMFSGPVDSRTQAQIAVVTQRAVERATRRTRI